MDEPTAFRHKVHEDQEDHKGEHNQETQLFGGLLGALGGLRVLGAEIRFVVQS
jgi:hypothetical protein